LRDRAGVEWRVYQSDHVTVYTHPGTYAASRARELAKRAERVYASNLRLLDLASYPHRLHLFYFDSAAAMEVATGRGGMGGGFPEAQTVFVVVNASRPHPDDGHEMAHVQSLTAWGLNQAEDVWLREGLGVLAQPDCWGAAFAELAAAARRAGDRRTMRDLSGAGFLAGDVDARFRAYMLSAAFVEHLLRGERTKFLELWRRGASAAPDIYGAGLETMEARWAGRLPTGSPRVATIDLVRIQRAGCGAS
jgi:hypothetical protein